MRTDVQFFEYAKENFIQLDRETAIERAKEQEQAQVTDTDDQKILKKMQEQIQKGETFSEEQVKHMETYRQKYTEQAASYQMVAEGGDVVLTQVGAYNPED